MKSMFFWKLCGLIAAGSVMLFFLIDRLSTHTEKSMSYIAFEHQQELLEYAAKAQELWDSGELEELNFFLEHIKQTDDTWVALVKNRVVMNASAGEIDKDYTHNFVLGRDISWKIHLYFSYNPVMDVVLHRDIAVDSQMMTSTHFLIRLPQRMRPGEQWRITYIILQIVLPLLVLSFLAFLIYRHIVRPLQILEKASQSVEKGDFQLDTLKQLGKRKDEFGYLAKRFEAMATRLGQKIEVQRNFIGDFSHEIRTPLARMETALDCASNHIKREAMLKRIECDISHMRTLAEDTLTLAWLDNETPRLQNEEFDLVDLVDVIIENAEFEFPAFKIKRTSPQHLPFQGCSRALGHALENIIRNALKHAPGDIQINVSKLKKNAVIHIEDNGPGVPEKELENIFKPFFKLSNSQSKRAGFGLGLALAYRQIKAMKGTISAKNRETGGLALVIHLPVRI